MSKLLYEVTGPDDIVIKEEVIDGNTRPRAVIKKTPPELLRITIHTMHVLTNCV